MIPYMIGKLAPNSSHLTRGFVQYVPGRDHFRAVFSQNGDKFVTPPPPPQSLKGSPLNGLTLGYLEGLVVRDCLIVWSLALCLDNAKQDPVVYGEGFGVVFLTKCPRTTFIQYGLDCFGPNVFRVVLESATFTSS